MSEQPLNFVKELLPRFDVPKDAPSQRFCIQCSKKISLQEQIYCACKCRVYCSNDCKLSDKETHGTVGCFLIQLKSRIITEKIDCIELHGAADLHEILNDDIPQNLYEFGVLHDRRFNPLEIKAYFKAREDLIKELIREAFALTQRLGTSSEHDPQEETEQDTASQTKTNSLALDIALMQCKDSFHLDKYDSNYSREDGLSPKKEYLMNLYLFTGRLQELYDVCCFYAQEGEQYLYEPDHCSGDIISPTNEAEREDITTSFFRDYSVHHRQFPYLALNHMFIIKYVLHMNMENLRLLQVNFLDNEDCVALIGEYAGIDKQWLVYQKNWYRDQAFEVLELFARSEPLSNLFGKIDGCSKIFFGSGKFKQIEAALKIGGAKIILLNEAVKREKRIGVCTSWICDYNTQKRDLEDLYKTYIEPVADAAAGKLNEIAGYAALGANFYSHFTNVTEFVTKAMEICDNSSNTTNCFQDFIDFMEEVFEDQTDGSFDSYDMEGFSSGLMLCLVTERRLVQSFYYRNHYIDYDNKVINKNTEGNARFLHVHKVLSQLPKRFSPYTFVYPPPLHEKDPFLNFPLWKFHVKEDTDILSKIKLVSAWLPDVTNVIDALFHAGLATDENLSMIFGQSSLVSNRLWELRKQNQTSIVSFFARDKTWKEGCVVYDSSTFMKIHYLTKADRRQQFEAMDDSARISMVHLEPKLSQFCEKFGWESLGIKSEKSLFHLIASHDQSDSVPPRHKRRRRDLDGIDSLGQACRLYFDTSLEEAIWDFLSIPRLRILKGTEWTMRNAGWVLMGKDPFLGDRSVILGKRIAVDGNGNSWGEKGCFPLCQHEPLPPSVY